ncbi:hypothetical protein OO015_08650 [Thermomicrobium sp. 4228-Ro]|uniref:hypothetical protein n=1 Tax=Thermomicrobium sp. 4228-Ro TaxID=2993937 RepID=UPI00224887EF|nr:hypothetical protein [Thermomicrobium sp. 4228-Ro]MCX2727562.1 hypothetical protein [Thermomicrobium sp. 4228-Ro]
MASPNRRPRWEDTLGTILATVRCQPDRPPPPPDRRIAEELEILLGARRELGSEYDPELVDAFLVQIQAAIEERIDTLWHERERRRRRAAFGKGLTLLLVLIAAIRLTLVAGFTAGATGIAVVWVGLVVLVLAAGFAYRV